MINKMMKGHGYVNLTRKYHSSDGIPRYMLHLISQSMLWISSTS